MAKDYEISSPKDKCIMCGREIDVLSEHPSALSSDDGDQVLLRYDYCADCWEKVKDRSFYSRWLARRKPKPAMSEREIKQNLREHALRLFEETVESEDPERHARLFILAHLLLRLRVFNWRGQKTEPETGLRFLVFEMIKTNDIIAIPQVNLTEDEIERAQNFIDTLLQQHNPGKPLP